MGFSRQEYWSGVPSPSLQKLLGDINWLRPSVGIPTYALQNLFKILEGSLNPNSPSQLTKEAREELALMEKHIQQSFSTRLDHDQAEISLHIFFAYIPH